ncbi:hypothetical protein ACEZCY_14790 [Streptacidiphilus sp. N1-12]|uniref:Uncharacterized protein n=2 Tax=Streptacidiphilus alkalitolerans TaxID=3342712 RepID=A0ABV6WEQ5_9ACTN
MALALETVTGTVPLPDTKTPAQGYVVFAPNCGVLVDPADKKIIVGKMKLKLDSFGSFSIALPPTDSTGIQPEANSWNWSVSFELVGATVDPFNFALLTGSGPVDLSEVIQVAPLDGDYLVVPGPPGPQGDPGPKGDKGDPGSGSAEPWVFDAVVHGGAVGDGRWVTDLSVTSGSAVATSATAAFTPSNTNGKSYLLHGASASGDAVTGTLTYVSATQVLLSAPAGTTVSGATFLWGTDDTPAFRLCLTDGTAYALAHSYEFKVYVPIPPAGHFYVVAGQFVTGGSTLGCAQIPLPVIPATGPKVTCLWEHAGNSAGLELWSQTAPNITGATIVSFGVFANQNAQGDLIGSDGNPCVIGGPTQPHGYGRGDTFSNLFLDFTGSILTTHSKTGLTYEALGLDGIANAQVHDFYIGTTGSVARGDYATFAAFGGGYSIGLSMPADGNNDMSVIRNGTIGGGYTFGVYATEHTDITALRILYCWAALCPVGNYYGSVGAVHSITGSLVSIEACTVLVLVIGKGSDGIGPTMYLRIDTETSTPRFGDRSNGNDMGAAAGEIVLGGSPARAGLILDGPPGFDIIDAHGTATTVTGNYTLSFLDEVVLVDASADSTQTLPTALSFPARKRITIKNLTAHTVTVAPAAGGQLIDGAATKTVAQWAAITLQATSSLWYTV